MRAHLNGFRPLGLVSATAAAALAGLVAAYAVLARPRLLTWGATAEEARAPMPGDGVVRMPRYQTTHAVTIDAPVDEVWPWLAQLGQGRGGLYSYQWLENLIGCDIHNADRIVPELQDLRVGDVIRLVPEDFAVPLSYRVLRVEPPTLLVLGPGGEMAEVFEQHLPYPSWTFQLRPLDGHRCRLVVRMNTDFQATTLAGLLANKYALEAVHWLMERRMLLGIKQRAEHHCSSGWSNRPPRVRAATPRGGEHRRRR